MRKQSAKKGSPKLTRDVVFPLIERSFGNLAVIASVSGVSRQAVSQFVAADPELAELVAAERERVKDLVERSLHKAAIDGKPWAVCFFLKTQAKDRGYVERTELTGRGGGPIGYADMSDEQLDDEIKRLEDQLPRQAG